MNELKFVKLVWVHVIFSIYSDMDWSGLNSFWVHVIFSICSYMNWSGLNYFEYTWYFQDYTRNQKVVTWFLLRRFLISLRVNATLLGNPLRELTNVCLSKSLGPSSVDWSLVILIPQNGWSTKTICEQGSWDLIFWTSKHKLPESGKCFGVSLICAPLV